MSSLAMKQLFERYDMLQKWLTVQQVWYLKYSPVLQLMYQGQVQHHRPEEHKRKFKEHVHGWAWLQTIRILQTVHS